jgi:hypothetical protein
MAIVPHFVRILPMATLYSSHTCVDGLALHTSNAQLFSSVKPIERQLQILKEAVNSEV